MPAAGRHAEFRLKRAVDFRAVHAAGKVRRGEFMALHWRVNEAGHPRLGITVSGKVGGAVVRNRVRRRLRELARPILAGSDRELDIVVYARPAASSASFAELEAEFRSLATKVLGL